MFNVHDHLKSLTVDELKEISSSDRLNFSVCLLNLEHDLNIGNCIRSAHILGAKRVFIFGKNKYDSRSTVGSHNYIDIIKYNTSSLDDEEILTKSFKSMCEEYKVSPLFIDKTDVSCTIYSKYFNSYKLYMDIVEPCFIFGNENGGIPEYLMKGKPQFHIPQRGVIRSLNVSSAAAIVINEFTRGLI